MRPRDEAFKCSDSRFCGIRTTTLNVHLACKKPLICATSHSTLHPRLAPILRARRMRSSSSGPPPLCTRLMRRALSMGWARETSWKRGATYLRNQSFHKDRKICMFCIMIRKNDEEDLRKIDMCCITIHKKMMKKICVEIIIDDQENIWYLKVWDRCDLGRSDRADWQHNPSGFNSSTYHVICITLSSYHVSNKNTYQLCQAIVISLYF